MELKQCSDLLRTEERMCKHRQKRRLLAAGTALTLLACAAFAQDSAKEEPERVSLTVEQAVDYANENSKSLKSSAIDLEIAKRAKKYSWNIFLPSVQATGTLNRTTASSWDSIVSGVGQGASFAAGTWIPQAKWEGLAENAGLKENESMHWAATGGISASLNLSLAQIYQIKAARASYESGKITWDQAVKDNTRSIKKMFYGLLLQQESLKIQQTSLQNARSRYDQAVTNFRNGRIPELQLLQAQVAYENQKPSVLNAENSFEQQLDLFAFMLGMPVGTKLKLEGEISASLKDFDADELIAQYSTNRIDVESLQKQLEILRLNKRALDLGSFTPALVLNYGWQPTLAPYALDFDKWSKSDNWNDNGSLSITLAWNLTNMLPFSANRQQAKDLEDNIRKLEIALEQTRDNAELEIRTYVDKLAVSKANIEASEQQINLAQRSYDMTLVAYRNGRTELLDVRDAENQLNQAKLGLANEEFNYISNLLDLEYSVNTELF